MQPKNSGRSASSKSEFQNASEFAHRGLADLHGLACIAEDYDEAFTDACERIEKRIQGGEIAADVEVTLWIYFLTEPGLSLIPIEVALAYWSEARLAAQKKDFDLASRDIAMVYQYMGWAAGILGELESTSTPPKPQLDSAGPRVERRASADTQDPKHLQSDKRTLERSMGDRGRQVTLRQQFLRGYERGIVGRRQGEMNRRKGQGGGGRTTAANMRSDKEAMAALIVKKTPARGWNAGLAGRDAVDAVLPAYRAILKARDDARLADRKAHEKAKWDAINALHIETSANGKKRKRNTKEPKVVEASKHTKRTDPDARLSAWMVNDPIVSKAYQSGLRQSKGKAS